MRGEPSSRGNVHHGENSVVRDPFILREPPTWGNPLLGAGGNPLLWGKPHRGGYLRHGEYLHFGETLCQGGNLYCGGNPCHGGNLHHGGTSIMGEPPEGKPPVSACVCAYTCIRAHTRTRVGPCWRVLVHARAHACVRPCVHRRVQAGGCPRACSTVPTCVCACARPCVHTRVCTSALFTLTPYARPLLAGCPLSPWPGHTVPPLPRHTARGPPCPPPARLRPRICYKWFCSACGTAGSSWAASEPEATGLLPLGRGG